MAVWKLNNNLSYYDPDMETTVTYKYIKVLPYLYTQDSMSITVDIDDYENEPNQYSSTISVNLDSPLATGDSVKGRMFIDVSEYIKKFVDLLIDEGVISKTGITERSGWNEYELYNYDFSLLESVK